MKMIIKRSNIPALWTCLTVCSLTLGMILLVSGCGGNGSSPASLSSPSPNSGSSTGRAVVTIDWPARSGTTTTTSRLIPEATDTIHIDMLRTVNGVASVIATAQATRPTNGSKSTVEIDNLPIDTLTVVANAYPKPDASKPGAAVATGTVPVTTKAGQAVNLTLTMNSTIDHLALTPAGATLSAGLQQPLTVTAWNGQNESSAAAVLLSTDKLQWSSSDTSLATVDKNGMVSALMAGNPAITVTDAESGKSVSTQLTVHVVVKVSPATATLSVTDATTLSASVIGSTNQGVIWSVQENGGGIVTSNGKYTAPGLPNTYHVIATSKADTTQSATATLAVQAGNITGTIQ